MRRIKSRGVINLWLSLPPGCLWTVSPVRNYETFSWTVPVETAPSQGLEMRRRNGVGEDQRTTATKEFFGADIQHKPDNVLRIGFKNINGFPNKSTNQVKYDVLRTESGDDGFQFDLQS